MTQKNRTRAERLDLYHYYTMLAREAGKHGQKRYRDQVLRWRAALKV